MIDKFPLLAIETSGDLCSVAVFMNEGIYSEINLLKKYVHSEKLLELIDFSLSSLELEVGDLGAIAVSMGPGSFTGLRIGLAAAKGIALGIEKPIIPVPTFEALAYRISSLLSVNTKLVIANKVNIDEVYSAEYIITESGYSKVGEIKVVEREKLESGEDILFFGDNKLLGKVIFSTATAIAKWAYIFGEDLLTFDFDYLEPNYLKQFKIRGNK